MKHQELDIYKNTPSGGDVIASAKEAKLAIKRNRLTMIGRGKRAYWVIRPLPYDDLRTLRRSKRDPRDNPRVGDRLAKIVTDRNGISMVRSRTVIQRDR